jgi:hypothetical protein
MTIAVQNLIHSTAATTTAQGMVVEESYGDSWKKEKLVLDFEGIRTVTPEFLSSALRPLLEQLDDNDIPRHVDIINEPPELNYMWKLVRQTAEVKRSLRRHGA